MTNPFRSEGIYSFIIIIFFGYLINSLTSFSLNFKNLIALEYLGLKDWTYLKIPATATEQVRSIADGNTSYADISLLDLTQIETLGQDLYTYGAVLLISLSIVLLLAMFATIIISKPNVLQPSTH